MNPTRSIDPARLAVLIVLVTVVLMGSVACNSGQSGVKGWSAGTDLAAVSMHKTRAAKMPGLATKAAESFFGTFETDDTQLDDGSYVDLYNLSAEAGAEITISMISSDVDSYILLYRVVDGGTELVAQDNDSYGDGDARLTVTMPSAGAYIIAANTAVAGETGGYLLQYDMESPFDAAPVNVTAGGALQFDTVVTGTLDANDSTDQEGRLYELFTLSGTEGQYLDLHLESNDFDTVISLFTGTLDAPDVYASNDDIEVGVDANSRLTGTLPQTATYTIQVKAYSGGGSYTLTTTGEPPVPAGPVVHDWAQLYPGGGDPAGRYALIVGIDDYPGTANDLGSCIADTRVMKDALIRRFGFDPANIVVLHDAEANREHIMNAFTRHLGQAGPAGAAVFYYSGHGLQMDDNYGLAAEFDFEDDGVDEAIAIWAVDQKNSVILDDELGMLAEGIEAGRMLVMLDSCHSGTGTRARGEKQMRNFAQMKDQFTLPAEYYGVKSGAPAAGTGGENMKELVTRNRDYVLLTAAAPDETALTGSDWPDYGGVASVFTYHLVKNFDAAGPNDTFEDIALRVREQSRDFTMSTQDHVQTAQFEGSQLGAGVQAFLGGR